MSHTVRVPDPVHERIDREAERRDMPKGEVVRSWMERSDELEDVEAHR